jgi:prepilin-type N-terminal cleavage/methylation domain-containing protein
MTRKLESSRSRGGFTLIEMLTVVVIIGILASLITAAAIRARTKAREAIIKMEIEQLSMAVENFKSECGAFPPNGFFLDMRHPDRANGSMTECQMAFMQVLRRAFPRYVPRGDLSNASNTPTDWEKFRYDVRNGDPNVSNSGYPYLDPDYFDAASVLVFFLGGLPEQSVQPTGTVRWKPAGFHSDPRFPFKVGTPRTKPLYDFDSERTDMIDVSTNLPAVSATALCKIWYYPKNAERVPFAYFAARRLTLHVGGNVQDIGYQYGVGDNFVNPTKDASTFLPLFFVHGMWNNSTDCNVCVPYLDRYVGSPTSSSDAASWKALGQVRTWRNPDSYQIICPGMDGRFGETAEKPISDDLSSPSTNIDRYRFRCTRTGENFSPLGHDHDNITNFSKGTLEDEML